MISSGTLALAGVFFGFGLKFYFSARREVGRPAPTPHPPPHIHWPLIEAAITPSPPLLLPLR